MTPRLVVAFLLALLLPALAPAAVAAPPNLDGYAYDQHPGARLPLQASFRDETGRTATLADFIDRRPTILVLGYFHCPNLCGIVRADLFNALGRTNLVAGHDYSLIALSIDPTEKSADAAGAKDGDRARFPLPGAAEHWHFLTGAPPAIDAVARAVGFSGHYDKALAQLIHPTGVVFITPRGVVSSYLLGVGYQPDDVRLGVTRAQHGTVAAAALPVLLLCYHFDPTTGRYTLAIMKLLRLAGIITVVTIAGTLFLAFRRGRRPHR